MTKKPVNPKAFADQLAQATSDLNSFHTIIAIP